MKFLVAIILTALLSFTACLFLPWWSIAFVACIVAAVIPQKPFRAFGAGFTALFLLWGGLSFWISYQNEHLLAGKISQLILQLNNPYLPVLASALIGGLVAGLAALAGSYLRKS